MPLAPAQHCFAGTRTHARSNGDLIEYFVLPHFPISRDEHPLHVFQTMGFSLTLNEAAAECVALPPRACLAGSLERCLCSQDLLDIKICNLAAQCSRTLHTQLVFW